MLCKKCQKKIKRYSKKHYQEYGNFCLECDKQAETNALIECNDGIIEFDNLIWRAILKCLTSSRNQVDILALIKKRDKKRFRRTDLYMR